MPAILGVRTRGTGQSSQLYRFVPGVSPISLGNNFALFLFTGKAGSIANGDVCTGNVSGATAKVTAVSGPGTAGGATPTLVMNTINGTFTASDNACTFTSGGTAAWSSAVALENAGTASRELQQNRVVVFRDNIVLAALGNFIWKLNASTSNVECLYALLHPASSAQLNTISGLYIFNISSAPLLGMVYGSPTAAKIYRVTSSDAVTFSEAVLLGTDNFTIAGPPTRGVVYQNVLYFNASYTTFGTPAHTSWDPANDTFVRSPAVSGLTSTATSTDYFVFQNRLVRLQTNSNSTLMGLWEWSGGTWVSRLTFTYKGVGAANANPQDDNNSANVMFDDGLGNLVLIYYMVNSTIVGFISAKVTLVAGVFTDAGELTNSIIPSNLRQASGGPASGARFQVIIDNDTTPGTPVIYLLYAPNDTVGTTIQAYQFVDISTAMTPLAASVGDMAVTYVHSRVGGGDRFYTLGQAGLDYRGLSINTDGSITITMSLSGGGTRTVKLKYNRNAEVCTGAGTLSTPSQGSMSGANTIINVPADTTVTTFKWLASTDGVSNLTQVSFQIEMS